MPRFAPFAPAAQPAQLVLDFSRPAAPAAVTAAAPPPSPAPPRTWPGRLPTLDERLAADRAHYQRRIGTGRWR